MIPRAYLQEWSAKVPWPNLRLVEQDLIICRALCDLFTAPKLRDKIVFRGGTAINKLHGISRADAEQRMLQKLGSSLTEDVDPLLPAGVRFSEDDAIEAFGRVWSQLIVRIKGEPWKMTESAVEELRQKRYPKLLKMT